MDMNELKLDEDFKDYDELLNWVKITSLRLLVLKKEYETKSTIVLQKAIEKGVDFKSLYGGNSERTRKKYVDEQLSDIVLEKERLKLFKEDDIRRISYLKRIIDMKIEMIKYL